MTHVASPSFWASFEALPREVADLAEKNFELLKKNPGHPSLNLKRVGSYWSVRVGRRYRALAIEGNGDRIVWFWIGPHSEYDRIIR